MEGTTLQARAIQNNAIEKFFQAISAFCPIKTSDEIASGLCETHPKVIVGQEQAQVFG